MLSAALSSLVTSAFLYTHEPRGDNILLATLFSYLVLASQHYVHTGSLWSSAIHAAALVIVHVGTVTLTIVLYRLSPFHPLASFPGPILNKITSIPLAIVAGKGIRHIVVDDLHKKYGTFVRIGPNKISVNSLDAVNQIYSSSQAFDKSENYRPGRSHDQSLFFMRDRTMHNHRRRMWAGAFTSAALQEGAGILNDRTEQLVECVSRRQDGSGVVNLKNCLDHWSIDYMADITFGGTSQIEFMQEGDTENVAQNAQNAIVLFETLGELPSILDIASRLPVNESYMAMERLAARLLVKRKQLVPKNDLDMCSFFLAQREDSTYPPLEGEDLNAEAVFAMEAGSDTTAAVLTIILFYLLSDRNVYGKLTSELDETFPHGEVTAADHQSLLDLPYLDAVVNEGLRMSTPFPGFPRVVPKEGAIIEGRYIPGGTIIAVPIYSQQMSPKNFSPSPMEFKPERWFEGGLGPDTITQRQALVCFLFGPFGCLGRPLAYRQLSVVIAHLLLAYDLTFAPSFDPALFKKGWLNMRTNILKYPLTVTAKRRSRS